MEGRELTPQECLDYAYGCVLREESVACGVYWSLYLAAEYLANHNRFEHRLYPQPERVFWFITSGKVCTSVIKCLMLTNSVVLATLVFS